ncbi:cilia- and flagella-associated protein 73 [Drosophila kikkawai]|uniref:Cilia- and flagella-associated protein 73 n=1 Tax=Drosophila kikkawai TaxID=30033 RepID=A0A6P4JGJ0_DROKI|nr:uncharacterized protein LOC108082716 [Drosophila kikkawai]KAH8334094.1 hypothetical protein KR059_006516 [Drosophila kikkawai]
MPRHRPTFKTDVIGDLDLSPEGAIDDYRVSRQQDQFFVKPPNWDSAGESIEMLYIANLREYEAMKQLQGQLLKDAKRQTAMNVHRIRKMNKIQERLRKRFVEVNGFIKDCADKKRSADKCIREETVHHEELSSSIDDFKTSIGELSTFRNALKATVAEFQPYEQVLDEVVKVSDIFVSPKDCIDRCDALMLAQVEIHELKSQKLNEIEKMRQRMVQITSEAALTVLGLKNDLARLERSYVQSRATCLKWEKALTACKDAPSNYTLDKDRMFDAILVLYRILCKRRDVSPSLHSYEIDRIMSFIMREIDLLSSVLREVESGKSDKLDSGQIC